MGPYETFCIPGPTSPTLFDMDYDNSNSQTLLKNQQPIYGKPPKTTLFSYRDVGLPHSSKQANPIPNRVEYSNVASCVSWPFYFANLGLRVEA